MKCPRCNEVNPDTAIQCSGCLLFFRNPLVLTGNACDRRFSIRTKVSRPTLKALCSDDGRFATHEPQFWVDTDGTDWFVEPGTATYRTHLNSTELSARTKLNAGDVLSIFVPAAGGGGEERAILSVSFLGG